MLCTNLGVGEVHIQEWSGRLAHKTRSDRQTRVQILRRLYTSRGLRDARTAAMRLRSAKRSARGGCLVGAYKIGCSLLLYCMKNDLDIFIAIISIYKFLTFIHLISHKNRQNPDRITQISLHKTIVFPPQRHGL